MSAPIGRPHDPISLSLEAPPAAPALEQASDAAPVPAVKLAPGQLRGDDDHTSPACGTIMSPSTRKSFDNPPIQQSPGSEQFAPLPALHRRRAWLAVVAGLACATIAVIVIGKVPLADIWRQATDRIAGFTSSSTLTPATSTLAAKTATPRLIVPSSPARAMSGEPAPLDVALQGAAEGAVVIITGLAPGMALSEGSAIGADAWQVPAADIGHVWIGPPENFVGSPDLVAELRLPDDTIADRQAIRIDWVLSISTGPSTSQAPAPHQLDREEIAAPPIAPVPAPQQPDRAEIAALPIAPATAAT